MQTMFSFPISRWILFVFVSNMTCLNVRLQTFEDSFLIIWNSPLYVMFDPVQNNIYHDNDY